MKRIIALAIFLFAFSCASNRYIAKNDLGPLWNFSILTTEEMTMANELLAYGLEHEALYTLLDTLKPISSLGFPLSYAIAKDSSMRDGDKTVVDFSSDSTQLAFNELVKWNNVLEALSDKEFTFLLIPFKRPWQGKRNLQLLVVRNDLLAKLLTEKAAFFGQWGFSANADPATVLTTIEYESRNDRYRAYGYLFGYPEHAVDFFVEASITEEETGEFVKRSFFSMPVAVGTSGYFTYATPKEYIPGEVDSVIYRKASAKLETYNLLKQNYLKPDGKVDALKLVQDYWKKPVSNQ